MDHEDITHFCERGCHDHPMLLHYAMYCCIKVGLSANRAAMYMWVYEPMSEMHRVNVRV